MATYHGRNITVEIFGSSHGEEVGVKIEGLDGVTIDEEKLQQFLDRRSPSKDALSTPRREKDKVLLTYGEVVTGVIKNLDVRKEEYNVEVPRPGHSDYSQFVKEGKILSGGGAYSGRMTAALCIAGGICKQLLEKEGVNISAKILDEEAMRKKAEENPLDSVGGVIECVVTGLKPGIGGPTLDRLEGDIAKLIFSIPAVKGVEFGAGFKVKDMLGSENNDSFFFEDEKVKTRTNNAGGLLGGVTTGMPLVVRAAIKPTPSIGKEQDSVNLLTGENCKITVKGRHDRSIVPRAVPCVEAACAIAIFDRMKDR
ncbi:MAG: chorismate synthase [Clostridia bacterium]|nr:chorismate synthase [Clostridia bacterium]